MQDWLTRLRDLDVELFKLGGVAFTVSSLLKLLLLLVALFWFAARLRRWTVDRMLDRTSFSIGERAAIGATAQYLVLGIGIVMVLENAGINLSALSVLAGAVGVGVGFGLQNIITNFVSGLIIMLERPIEIGDQVQLDGVEGTVETIGARRTTLMTSDHIAVLVPNQRLILENVVNLMHAGRPIRLRLLVPIPAGMTAPALGEMLLELGRADSQVLAEPAPEVLRPTLTAAQLELCVWHRPDIDRQGLTSRLNTSIDARLTASPMAPDGKASSAGAS